MNRFRSLFLGALLISGCSSAGPVNTAASQPEQNNSQSSRQGQPVPVREGTLANEKLIYDAMVGVAARITTLGCSEPENFKPYVLKMPEGNLGSRVWFEQWVVTGCGETYPVTIRFNESGASAADWTVQ